LLLQRIDALSVAGSQLALDRITDVDSSANEAALEQLSARSGMRMQDMISTQERPDLLGWLQQHGWRADERLAPHERPWGTINVLALDTHGEMCVGVSTSGYPYKYPGRVGDSAVPGAGNYCDLRSGGAACTGRSELSLRAGTARHIVDLLVGGLDPAAACHESLADAALLPDAFRAELCALALTPDGRHGGSAGTPGATYAVMTADDQSPRTESRSVA